MHRNVSDRTERVWWPCLVYVSCSRASTNILPLWKIEHER